MQTETEQLQQENTILKARNHWLENVTAKMVVMIGNASSVLEEYVKTVDQLRVELENTRNVYSRLHDDLQEAFSDNNDNEDRLSESKSPDADA